MKKIKKILVIGTGSISKRHTKNICKIFGKKKLDIKIYVFSNEIERAKKFSKSFKRKIFIIKKKNDIKKIKFDYIIIACDISRHIKWLKFLKKEKAKIFCEKPLVIEKKDINWLDKNKIFFKNLFVGFQYRFSPVTIKLKSLMQKKLFGKLLFSSFEIGQDIKDWRKGNNFKKEFAFGKTSKRKRSVIWELCHDIDLMFYLIGFPNQSDGQEDKIKYKKIYTKDFAHLVATFKNGSRAVITQNMFSPVLYKNINLIFEKKIINADYIKGMIVIKTKNKIKKITLKNDRNISFTKELESFFNNKHNTITLRDGLRVSKFISNFQKRIK